MSLGQSGKGREGEGQKGRGGRRREGKEREGEEEEHQEAIFGQSDPSRALECDCIIDCPAGGQSLSS